MSDLSEIMIYSTSITGVVGMDAATIAFSEITKIGTITLNVGVIGIIMANTINFFAKMIYAYMGGTRDFLIKFSFGILVMMVVSFFGLVIIL